MRSVDEDVDGMYARWLLEDAQIRAMARRQLSLGIPVVIAGAFVAVIATFNSGHAAAPILLPDPAPMSAPASHHAVVLASGEAEREIAGRPAGVAGSPNL